MPMSGLWQQASEASARFGAQALDYDRYRPRYPEGVFDDILSSHPQSAGTEVIEIGAGTGIATESLVRRGVSVIAIEPSPEMAALTQAKLNGRGSVFVGRFEGYAAPGAFQLVACFNAWHWLNPEIAVDRVEELLPPAARWPSCGPRSSHGVRNPLRSAWPRSVATHGSSGWTTLMVPCARSVAIPASRTLWSSITSLSAHSTHPPSLQLQRPMEGNVRTSSTRPWRGLSTTNSAARSRKSRTQRSTSGGAGRQATPVAMRRVGVTLVRPTRPLHRRPERPVRPLPTGETSRSTLPLERRTWRPKDR